MTLRTLLCVFGILACLTSCTGDQKQPTAPPAAPAGPDPTPIILSEPYAISDSAIGIHDTIVEIEGMIAMVAMERYPADYELPEGWVGVAVSQRTDRIYGCFNYSIVQDVEVEPGRIVFEHSGIYMPSFCLTALGPAGTLTYLGAPTGEYAVEFRNQNQTDEYRLTITDTTVEFLPIDTSYTRADYRLFWRPRPNSFAFYCGTTVPTSHMCDDFIDSLMSQLELEEFQYGDAGVIPFKEISMGHWYDAPARFFLYNSEDDFQAAGEILEAFTASEINGQQGIGLELLNWKGERFMSWQFPGGK